METQPPSEHLEAVPPLLSEKRWRWWLHLGILAAYPILLGVIPSLLPTVEKPGHRPTLLPNHTTGLLTVAISELLIFACVFAAAWSASRARAQQLLLRWNGASSIFAGLAYSIGLRILVMIVMALIVIAATVLSGNSGDVVEKLRPRTEVVVDPGSLTSDTLYFWLTLTLISFVVAGFREELWRSGILAGLQHVSPKHFMSLGGRIAGAGIAAVIFGLGHLPQGWGGAAATALLGFGLGIIMIYHRSIWEAVFAHGFFNAASFLMLSWLSQNHPDLVPGFSR